MLKFFATPGNSRSIFPPNPQFQANSVSLKKFLLISIHGIVFAGIVVAIIFEVADYKLEQRSHTGVYNNCHKIWSARGIYESRQLQNSIQSINAAFRMDAKGVEIDMFYDSELNNYVVSHDYPYNLKNGSVLTLFELLNNLEQIEYIWIDFKKLRKLGKNQLRQAISRLEELSAMFDIKDKFYIEGGDPFNLHKFALAGFNTIFDIHPLPSSYALSGFMIGLYKVAYWLGGFSVIGLQYSDDGELTFDETMSERLESIPLFIYHVPENKQNLDRLLRLPNVRVFLVGRSLSKNRFATNACND